MSRAVEVLLRLLKECLKSGHVADAERREGIVLWW